MTDIGTLLAEKSLAKQQEIVREQETGKLVTKRVIPELYELLKSNISSYNSYPGINDRTMSISRQTDKLTQEEMLLLSSSQIKQLRVSVEALKLHVVNEDITYPALADLEEYFVCDVDGQLVFDHRFYPRFKGLRAEGVVERILNRAINWNTPGWNPSG